VVELKACGLLVDTPCLVLPVRGKQGDLAIAPVDISLFPAKVFNTDVYSDLPDEGRQAFRFFEFAGTQSAQGHHEGILAKIAGEMNGASAIEQDQHHAVSVAFDEFALSRPVARRDTANQVG
jgi:hypothetical protein